MALASLGSALNGLTDNMRETVVVFSDDENIIPSEAVLYRRVTWDKIGGRDRCPSGMAGTINANCFTDYPSERALELGYAGPCMSIGISTVLKSSGFTPDKMLEGYEGYGLAQVTASEIRSLIRGDGSPCPQGIMLVETDMEPWHGIVFDLTDRPRKAGARKAMARVASWAVPLMNE
jgi:hypothetical protein